MRKSLYKEMSPRMYRCWKAMRARCNNPKSQDYSYYGGKGVKVAKEWDDYEVFFWDMQSSYSDELTLDRIDVNGNYCKSNCRWATKKEQANNRTSNIVIEYRGRKQTAKQWSEELDLSFWMIIKRVNRGLSAEQVLAK